MQAGTWLSGASVSGAARLSTLQQLSKPLAMFPLRVIISHKSGGQKLDTFVQQTNNEIVSINFEIGPKGMGTATIDMHRLDLPLDADDNVKIYYNEQLIYQGFISTTPDTKGGKIKIQPYTDKLLSVLYDGDFPGKTIEEILQTVIQSVQDDTKVEWNSSFVSISDTSTRDITYEYEYPKKLIQDLIDRVDDQEYTIDANNTFNSFVRNTTTIDRLLLQNDRPAFASVLSKNEYQKNVATRYQVFRKSAIDAAETVRVGEVGYGGSYPTLAIETLIGKKEAKLVVSEILTNPEALVFAYAKLQADLALQVSTMVKGIDITKYLPAIFDRVKVEDYPELQLYTFDTCEDVTKWDNSSLDSTSYVDGAGSMQFTTQSVYDFGKVFYTNTLVKQIGFSYKSTVAGEHLYVSVGTDRSLGDGLGIDGLDADGFDTDTTSEIWVTEQLVPLANSNQWFYYSFDFTDNFRYIGFRTTSSATINIDRLQAYMWYRNIYTGNIVLIKFKVDKNGINIDATLDNIDMQANDIFFSESKRIEALEIVTTTT